MRAAQTQSLLAAVERLPSADRTKILSAVGPDGIARASAALPLAWLPMSLHMHISDCVRDVVGPERNVEIWRATMTHAFDRPLLRSFVEMTTRIFGVTPAALFKRGDKVYELITKRVGTFSCSSAGPGSARLTLVGFPAHRYRFICYVEGLAGCLAAVLDLCKCPGSVTVVDHDATGRVVYEAVWTERSPAA